MEKKKVALYVRVSSQEQKREGLSISAQINKLNKYCEGKGWDIYDTYVDEGVSGGSVKKRKGFQRMLEDSRNDNFSAIVFTKLDRAFRSVTDALKTSEEMKNIGVDLVSVSENIDTTTPIGKFFFVIISALAELERQMTAERNKDIKWDKFYQGLYPHPNSPFGYKWKNRKLIIDKSQSKKVREIFELRSQGLKPSKIAKKVGMGTQSIINILKNKVYMGYIEFEGQEKKGIHEPLISENLYNQINGREDDNIQNN